MRLAFCVYVLDCKEQNLVGFQKIDDETMQRVVALSEFSVAYIVLMATSGILSAVALLTNSIPVLIGSMVIAPALTPLA